MFYLYESVPYYAKTTDTVYGDDVILIFIYVITYLKYL